ncbi:translin [Myriangium duriaei CBS 260.36]|uniref:Translin n=1 Tax=Myriangium duriaei CBS 260.36 TaxID=1168546 RepID=A0A9P4J691_9PEZI|nr:translin [Myriangium duriaei CBS 260.36]
MADGAGASAPLGGAMFDPAVFISLQQKIDEDTAVREELKDIVQTLEKQDRATQSILSRAHSTPAAQLLPILDAAQSALATNQIATLAVLSEKASRHPYYKYNGLWTRAMQDCTFTVLLLHYLRGFASTTEGGQLLTPEQVGNVLGVPVNLKDRDAFHLTIEEYLHAVISLTDELTRLTRNAVTLQNHTAPLAIARFIKDLHAGFQLLNLKNDALRKRGDAIKYRVKEVEDVVYDLSLRGLARVG